MSWETTPTRPFCSERCKTRDLGAWSAERYRLEAAPSDEGDETWSGAPEES